MNPPNFNWNNIPPTWTNFKCKFPCRKKNCGWGQLTLKVLALEPNHHTARGPKVSPVPSLPRIVNIKFESFEVGSDLRKLEGFHQLLFLAEVLGGIASVLTKRKAVQIISEQTKHLNTIYWAKRLKPRETKHFQDR